MFRLFTIRTIGFVFLVCFALAGGAWAGNASIFEDDFETGDTFHWSQTQPPQPPDVFIDPVAADLLAGEVVEIQARGRNMADRDIEWSVTSGDLLGQGSRRLFVPDGTGLFTVTATSVADPSLSATATITVRQPPRIEFVGDRSAVVDGTGASVIFEVEVYDFDDQPVPSPSVAWLVDDPSVATVEDLGNGRARVTAIGSVGSFTSVSVTSSIPTASTSATFAVADLAAETVVVPSTLVRSRDAVEVVLDRTPTTETLSAGQVVVSGDQAGLLDRILSVDVGSTTVTLSVEPAALDDAFDALSLREDTPLLRGHVAWAQGDEGVVTLITADGQMLERSLIEGWDCELGGQPYSLDFEESSVSVDFSVSARAEVDVSFTGVDLFELALVGTLSMNADAGSLSFDSSVAGEVECSKTIGTYTGPRATVYGFTFAPSVMPVIGLKASASFDGPTLDLVGPEGSLTSQATQGIRYTGGSGWSPIEERSFSPSFSLPTLEASFDTSFEAEVAPFGRLDFGVDADLGRPPFKIDLAEVQFAALTGSAPFSLGLETPFDPADIDYTGPTWGLLGRLEGDLKADLTGGLFADVLDRVGVDTSFAGPLQLFSLDVPFAGLPTYQADPEADGYDSCPEPVSGWLVTGDEVRWTLTTGGSESGELAIWGRADGETTLSERATAAVSGGSGEAVWTLPDDALGTVELRDRIVVDPISETLPYTTGTALDIEVYGGDGLPRIESVAYPSTMIGDGRPYTTTVDFSDSNGGIDRLEVVVVADTCGGCANGGFFDPGVLTSTSGTIQYSSNCTTTIAPFTVWSELRLSDCAGNVTAAFPMQVDCVVPIQQGDGGGGDAGGEPGFEVFVGH